MTSVPAQLIIGSSDLAAAHALQQLRQAFCPQQGTAACFCTQCRWLGNRQHPGLVWLCPEGDYTLDTIEVIFEKTRFQLNDGEQFFFVLEKANQLTLATANRLLKTLEEPPVGYHFLLLTSNAEAVIPTVTSRCLTTMLSTPEEEVSRHPLLQHFINQHQRPDPFALEQELKKLHLDDTASIRLFEQLAIIIGKQYQEALLTHDDDALAALHGKQQLIDSNLRRLPQSGSSDLFWKQLWLQWHP